MNFIAEVEEHLRDLGSEARKNHPGVKEASERAILQLRSLQNAYVTAVRKATQTGTPHPTTALFRSQDILRPFLLAANYPNASPKLLQISLESMSFLIKGNAICPGDGIHMVRVWTIQANVCATALGKSSSSGSRDAKSDGNSGDGTIGSASTGTASSSWFGMLSSAASTSVAAASPSNHEHKSMSATPSSGAPSKHRAAESERVALQLLRLLIQLLELSDLDVTDEQWTASVSLCCILLDTQKHTGVVPQAAKSTLFQVLSLLVERTVTEEKEAGVDFWQNTWKDLLVLATAKSTPELHGAFSQCTNSSQGPVPPSPAVCLELLHSILTRTTAASEGQEVDSPLQYAGDSVSLLTESIQLVTSHFVAGSEAPRLELLWRSSQLACALLTTATASETNLNEEEEVEKEYKDYQRSRKDLLESLVASIVRATEACRNNHDFEDGYIFSEDETVDTSSKRKPLHTLIPEALLWKAGLALEILHVVFSSDEAVGTTPSSDQHNNDSTWVARVAEAVSDFCTIGASCRDHMWQLLLCAGKEREETHTLFHKAEMHILHGSQIKSSASTAGSEIMGPALWTAFHCLIQLPQHASDGTAFFAPTLAMLQHCLKRFPGSSILVQCTLKGYSSLANVIMVDSSASGELHRKALLTSLCKLSLPSWGKPDWSCQLENHNIETIVCLLKIVEQHYDRILSEWNTVLRTLEELSILSIASPKLSDEAYQLALAIAATFARLAPLSACMSAESISCLVDALAETVTSLVETRGMVADGDRPLDHADDADARKEKRGSVDQASIGGKLMSFAGRTLLGSSSVDASEGKETEPAAVERTKSTYYGDYRQDFLARLSSSKRAVRKDVISKLPFSMIVFTDVALVNVYRFATCGKTISTHLCTLAAASADIRGYAMDTLAMLITSQLLEEPAIPSPFVGPGRVVPQSPGTNKFFVVEQAIGGEQSISDQIDEVNVLTQVDLVGPLCTAIQTEDNAEVAEASMSALHVILGGAGHHLKGFVWANLIKSVASLSGDISFFRNGGVDRSGAEWSSCGVLAFRCLKLIVDDFIDQLATSSDASAAPRTVLLDCCASFGSSRHDVNTSLTSIGLLWSIADQDDNSESIDLALSKMVFLSGDDRAEVRNCAVNTLFSCVVGRGRGFTESQWESCICQTIFGVYERVLSRGGFDDEEEAKSSQANGDRAAPTASSHSRYKVSVHHSRDSVGKQWAATEVIVLQGLSRVLRNSFYQIVGALDHANSNDDSVWFEEAWSRILGYASSAAGQRSSKDMLDLRIAGIELLVLCNQLSCHAGIQAAITPARVGTHMEVVGGALRSVRDSNAKTLGKEGHDRSSEEAEVLRDHLFLSAFDTLEALRYQIEEDSSNDEDKKSSYIESVHVQVLHKLSLGLGKLYECCKDDELSPARASKIQRRASRAQRYLGLESEKAFHSDDIEGRFVDLVTAITKNAVTDPGARYLSQAQRAAFDLLRLMSSQGSNEALRVLASVGDQSFFWEYRKDEGSKQNDVAGKSLASEVLSREAAKIVAEEISKDSLSDQTKVEVLCRVLCVFAAEADSDGWRLEAGQKRDHHRKRCYKYFVPVIDAGLRGAQKLESQQNAAETEDRSTPGDHLLNFLWEKVVLVLSEMFCPVQSSAQIPYMSKVASLLEILVVAVPLVPERHSDDFCAILASGASKSLEVAKVHVTSVDSNERSRKRHDEALQVFGACLSGLCRLQPDGRSLHLLVAGALGDAITSISDNTESSKESGGNFEVAMVVIRAIRENEEMEPLVIAVFSLLCKLVSVENTELRKEVGKILGQVDVGAVLTEATTSRRDAEEQARLLEERNEELLDEIDELRDENSNLQQQIAVYSTSSALT